MSNINPTKVAILGASGYSGAELVRILLGHEGVELVCVTSRSESGRCLADVFPRFRGVGVADSLNFIDPDVDIIKATNAEIAFLALPHGIAAGFARSLLDAGLKVIDLSADFRISDAEVYEEFYGTVHPDPELLSEAVYGLPEIRPGEISEARLVASPGCYPTSVILPLLPLLADGLIGPESIQVVSMSGTSGAGRKADTSLLFAECNESLRAYSVPRHRHLSEIEQELSIAADRKVTISFTPILTPVTSGIYTTVYAAAGNGAGVDELNRSLDKAYGASPFVRLLGENIPPDTKNVTRSNFIDIGWAHDRRTGRFILMSAEDNLVKGASGQAVQSLNLMSGFPETSGLMGL
ncbi:MAG: N-acetyl-gamma-glutamyl-phosphate reductase [Verrucomicrobiaceae bacterium]|nr:N-acetyl-gamma-glutamyl-phosphate reductase [Verrucomicrobiaceae bacterium]